VGAKRVEGKKKGRKGEGLLYIAGGSHEVVVKGGERQKGKRVGGNV